MNYIDEEMLKEYEYDELIKIRKWLNDYIVTLDKDNIPWHVFDHSKLKKFLLDNYYDDEFMEEVYWLDSGDKMPLGMYFLSFPKRMRKIKYFLGTIKNRLNKETIVAAISYLDNCEIGEESLLVTSVEGIEINYFYRGEGLLKLMMDEFAKIIDPSQNILVTSETPLGKKHRVMEHLKEALVKNHFSGDVRFEDEIDDAYLEKMHRK